MNETLTLSTKDKFLAHFEKLDFSFDEDFSKAIRTEAERELEGMEFPTSKTEYWKYTRINKIINADYHLNSSDQDFELDLSVPTKNCLVLVNGYYAEELSWFDDENNFKFSSLSEAKGNSALLVEKFNSLNQKEEIFARINTAYHQDGAFVHIPKNTKVEDPIYIIHIQSKASTLANPRNFIYLEEGAEAKVVMKNLAVDSSKSFCNMLTEVLVSENAHLEINKIQEENAEDFQICNELVQQQANSQFKINTFTLNGALVRNNLNIELLGSNTETWLNGFYPLKGKQHVDNHTFVLHREPNCVSHELYKGILDDASTGVFNGKVYVHREAQKTNAYQSNANMVLTDNASANSKPELEIYADDVKCSHGSVTGQLDEEAMFYLRSRGMSAKSARAVLLNAFASDILEQIGVEAVRDEMEAFIDRNYQGA